MKNSDRQNARTEHDRVRQRTILELLSDHTDPFNKWLGDAIFTETHHQE